MPRNMSFSLTTDQVRNRTKTVTRRLGWWFLKPDEIVNAVVKAMGLKKGEKIERIDQICIIDTRPEPLNRITKIECIKEGFPEMRPEAFIDMFCRSHKKCRPDSIINRIEFEYF